MYSLQSRAETHKASRVSKWSPIQVLSGPHDVFQGDKTRNAQADHHRTNQVLMDHGYGIKFTTQVPGRAHYYVGTMADIEMNSKNNHQYFYFNYISGFILNTLRPKYWTRLCPKSTGWSRLTSEVKTSQVLKWWSSSSPISAKFSSMR